MQETIELGNTCHSLEFSNSKFGLTGPRGLRHYFCCIALQSQLDPWGSTFSTEAVHGHSGGKSLGKTLGKLGKTPGKPWGKLCLLLRKKTGEFTEIGWGS